MNFLKPVLVLAIVALLVVSTGAAGTGAKTGPAAVITPAPQQTQGLSRVSDPELRHVSSSINIDMSRSNPGVRKEAPSLKNSSLSPQSLEAGLSGTYNIPGAFSNIASAVAVLEAVGASGPVTFQLTSTSYTENTVLFSAPYGGVDGSGTNKITIKPAAGVAATVKFVTDSTHGKGFAFNGANNVTIDGVNSGGSSLTLTYATGNPFPSGDAFAATVYLTNGSTKITVKNATINGEIKTASTFFNQTDGRPAVFAFRAAADAAGNNNDTVDNCTIINATFAWKALTETFGNTQGPLSYTNNKVGGAYGGLVSHGGLTDQVFGMHYDRNIMNGIEFVPQYWNVGPTEYDIATTFGSGPGADFFLSFGQPSAGHFYNMDAASTVSYNQVLDAHQNYNDPGFAFIVYGLLVRVGGGPSVHDNRITGVTTTDVDGTIVGLRNEAQALQNSVRLTGAMLATQTSYAMRAAGGTSKNNAFSNEMTGASASRTRALQGTPAGTSDYNAMFSNGQISTQSSLNGYLATGQDGHSVFGPVNFSANLHIAGGPSSAENIGLGGALAAADVDGDVRSVTTPDAGADEFANTGLPVAIDILPTAIISPNSGGVPAGLPVAPVVTVKNNSNQVVGAFSTQVTITDGYSQTVATPGGIPAQGSVNVTFPNWAAPAGSWTIQAKTLLADANSANDSTNRAQVATAPVAVATSKIYTWDASDDGWTRTVDFVRKSTFTKLGGPLAGASMVTERPNLVSTYTEGAYANTQGYAATYPGPNLLISPWFDLSGMSGPDVYVSFSHSINVEPGWDGSWMEYTTDGVNWKHLGALSDANGINWYSAAVYANAASYIGDPPDTTTMKLATYALFGPGKGITTLPTSWWTSNGDPGANATANAETGPAGPTGYVFCQLHITAATYADIVHAPLVKFRYVAFSDAAAAYAGWAVDNWRIGNTGSSFAGGAIKGHVFNDVNGNGVNNAEPNETGLKVYKSYFGVLKDSAITDGSGNYSFSTDLPGIYNIQVIKAGYAFTIAPVTGIANVNSAANNDTVVQDFGTFLGSISGQKYNDHNNNGTFDAGDAGLSGWTITLHKDSCNGAVLQTAVTAAGGNYSFVVLPGTYYLNETLQAGWRQTEPAVNCIPVTTSGNSGSGTAVVTGKNFGNYKIGVLKIEADVDLNGNGVKDAGDVTSMPAGPTARFELKKGATHLRYDTLGNGSLNVLVSLDTGSYSVTETFVSPGWTETFPGSPVISFTIDSSASNRTTAFGQFKLITVSGTKFEDLNGNGVKDSLEPGLAGWKINIRGGVFYGSTSAITDANGNWSIDSVAGAKDTITEVNQAGWTETLPATGLYAISVLSGSNVTGENFGNFHNVTVSGVKYRDRNASGARDAGEEGLSGWQLNLTGNGGGSTISAANGTYSFPSVGPGAHVLTETPQAGWIETQPAGGNYSFNGASGVNVTASDFGNFQSSDSTVVYRTLSVAELVAGAQVKPLKRPKPGKPIVMPNVANVLAELYLQNGNNPGVIVGVSTAVNAAGKSKAYLLPGKYTDVQQTMWKKGISHNPAIARGYDFDNKSKQMLKRQKSLPATKQDNGLTAELLSLSVNIAMSDLNKAQSPGLGELIYNDGLPAHSALNGMTVRQIKAAGDTLMTNFEFQPLSAYQNLQAVARAIDTAFSGPFDTVSWIAGAKIKLTGVRNVVGISYLKANPNAEPRITPVTPFVVQQPTKYALYQNYPNPFNPTTIIEFDLPSDAFVTLKVYNILGQQIATLYDHELLGIGNNDVEFDATALPSGIYFYRLVAQSVNDDGVSTGQTFKTVKKMMMVK